MNRLRTGDIIDRKSDIIRRMPRTIINLTDDDKRWLDRQARQRQVSMTSLVSEAVSLYRAREEAADRPDLQSALRHSAGVWQRGDGLAWQERLRGEWDERSCDT